MTKPIRITAIYKKEPEIRLYVLALIELARQLHEEERAASVQRGGKQENAADA